MSTKSAACCVCGKPIRATEAVLYTNTAAGARTQVHIACLRIEQQQHSHEQTS